MHSKGAKYPVILIREGGWIVCCIMKIISQLSQPNSLSL